MGAGPFKDQTHFLTKRLLPGVIYALLPLALFRFYFYPPSFNESLERAPQDKPIIVINPPSKGTSNNHLYMFTTLLISLPLVCHM